MGFCSVYKCVNRYKSGSKIAFYRLPAIVSRDGQKIKDLTTKRRAAWVSKIRRKNLPESARVCSNHFISGKPAPLLCETDVDWIPTQNLGHDTFFNKDAALGRCERRRQRASQQSSTTRCTTMKSATVASATVASAAENDFPENNFETSENVSEVMTENTDNYTLNGVEQTNEKEVDVEVSEQQVGSAVNSADTDFRDIFTQTDENIVSYNNLLFDNIKLREEVNKLQLQLKKTSVTNIDSFENDSKVKFYTGLKNKQMLRYIVEFIKPEMINQKSILSVENKILLVLIRLRLNLNMTDLSYRFGVSVPTVSRMLTYSIPIMSKMIKKLVIWPERDVLRLTMPNCFREAFGDKVTVIIDCFEIPIEKPSNLLAQAATWSSYKGRNTVKYLIGIAPQGFISFISRGFGGRSSDKIITESCGILKNLLRGDVILADRGFRIEESVALYHAVLGIPAFTKGKNQLEPLEIEATRNIANVRIHVERVIGCLRQKYTYLHNCLNISNVQKKNYGEAQIDYIVALCCGLFNVNPSVVPFE